MSYASKSSVSLDDPSMDLILQQLEENSYDLQVSLDAFVRDREGILKNQKLALARYEAELMEIEASDETIGNFDPKTATVDHNIFKHLSLNKDMPNKDEEKAQNQESNIFEIKRPRQPIMLVDQSSHIERNKRFTDLDQVPPPNFEEKRKVREEMFFFLEEATIEETRLELEIDQARENRNLKLVEELSDALFILQRMNAEKLSNMVTEYQPQPFSKSWGSDPEYAKLSRQLLNLAETYTVPESQEILKKR